MPPGETPDRSCFPPGVIPGQFPNHHPGHIRLESDLYATAADGLKALGYTPEEDPKWDVDFGAVGAIMIGENGELLAGADPREETTALAK